MGETQTAAIRTNRRRNGISGKYNVGCRQREVLVLGAFGCGAFGNRPEIVAEAFRAVLKQYMQAFKVIEFAVYCKRDDTHNYQVFAKKFGKR